MPDPVLLTKFATSP